MRTLLANYQRKRKKFYATFECFVLKYDNQQRPFIVWLARDVCFMHASPIADHAWVVTKWRSWPEHLKSVRRGDILEFDAEIVSYLKRYVTHETDSDRKRRIERINWIKDYGLRYPTFAVKREPSKKHKMSHNEVKVTNTEPLEIPYLQEDLEWLISALGGTFLD